MFKRLSIVAVAMLALVDAQDVNATSPVTKPVEKTTPAPTTTTPAQCVQECHKEGEPIFDIFYICASNGRYYYNYCQLHNVQCEDPTVVEVDCPFAIPGRTTTRPVTTTPPPPPKAAHWGQCGGINWTGATTCEQGYTCTKLNDWYFQCL